MNRNRNMALSFVFIGLPVCFFFLFDFFISFFSFSPLRMKIPMELFAIFSLILFTLFLLCIKTHTSFLLSPL
ncbi:hypothetical protein HQ43_00735 [Porphyromonas canoris]|uniref:Uncharacterized protein n=1 Tax=Porphyromonas canoris TaxID=36875 RepID=A0ABR4XPL7_9PORP|nr:hypothetical protein HQ43_00735 [Porphyromonas canoris]